MGPHIIQPMFITAAILGVVEGITEFIPVSSTGHLILASTVLRFPDPFAKTFDIAVQFGAILAAIVVYWSFFKRYLHPRHWFSVDSRNVLLACAPPALMGALFHKKIKVLLFSPAPVAIALIGGGLILLWMDQITKKGRPATDSTSTISAKQAAIVGVAQIAALWPGMSRSGAAIVGGVLGNVSYETSAAFSFIVAVPLLTAAMLFDLGKTSLHLSKPEWISLGIGLVVAFAVALSTIRLCLYCLSRFKFRPFAIYRIALGLIILFMEWKR